MKILKGWFKRKLPDCCNVLSSDLARRILARFIILSDPAKADHCTLINNNLANAIFFVGEVVCGDEKVFSCDGKHQAWLRVVQSKKQVGVWVYELCVWLEQEKPFLLNFRPHTELANLDEHVPVSSVMKQWTDIIDNKHLDRMHRSCLVVDSYYPDKVGLNILRQSGVYFVWAIQQNRFGDMCAVVDAVSVDRAGKAAYAVKENRRNRGTELISYAFVPGSTGPRWTLTNYLVKSQSKHDSSHFLGQLVLFSCVCISTWKRSN